MHGRDEGEQWAVSRDLGAAAGLGHCAAAIGVSGRAWGRGIAGDRCGARDGRRGGGGERREERGERSEREEIELRGGRYPNSGRA